MIFLFVLLNAIEMETTLLFPYHEVENEVLAYKECISGSYQRKLVLVSYTIFLFDTLLFHARETFHGLDSTFFGV